MEQVEKYILLIIAWGFYFLSHSVLASSKIKTFFKQKGLSLQTQRLVYTIFSAVGLLALLLFNGAVKSDVLLEKSRLSQIISLFIAAAGVLIINAAFKQYKFRSFVGLEEEKEAKLQREGILNFIRHPIYLGTILIVIGFVIYDPRVASVISALCIFLYLPIGIYFEEQKLIETYGDRYIKYKKEVPAIFPDLSTLLKKIT